MENKKEIIYFITGNTHKFKEVLEIFQNSNLNYTLKQKNLNPIEIQTIDLREIALFKLNSVKDKLNASFFVEDAGFFVEKPLNGFPGVYSSYVFKTLGNEGILKLINDFQHTKAYFASVIALYFKPFKQNLIFEAKVEGKVSERIRGKGGFGFDPIFVPNIMPNKTFAELSINEKNKISHRGKVLKKLIDFLKKN
ncbi:MAG: RdgB/HAM1 family non-canonical purine NTP pyrophosphatase [Promethearchaeota archaeon]